MKNYSADPSRQYHIQVASGEIGRYVMLPGDPGRCEEIASLLDDARLVACNREFKTYTGYIDGEKVSVCSTGIGGPSAVIAVEELFRCGADTFVRVGTCGGMQLDVKSGDVVIGNAAVRAEGTSREIAPIEYPAAASYDITNALSAAAKRLGQKTHVGVVQCKDSYYGQHVPESMPVSRELAEKWEAWKRMGCLASEMESAAIYICAAHLGARAGGCCLVVANQEREALGKSNPVVHDTLRASRVAVEGIRLLIEQDRQRKLEELTDRMSPECLLYDFDGTLSFTEEISYQAFKETAEKYGVIGFGEHQWLKLVGHTDAENWRQMMRWYPDVSLPDDIDALVDESREAFLRKASGLTLNPWVLGHLGKDCGARRCIVTNNKERIVRECLEILGIAGMFDSVISCADSGQTKEQAWETMRSGAPIDRTVVFEDNPDALRLALSLGYAAVAVRHMYNEKELDEIDGLSLIVG